jgi:hypothetical protein
MRDLAFVVIGILVLVALVLTPFVSIWALNTLFALGIEYTIWTWLAMLWVSLVAFGSQGVSIKKKYSDGK